MNQPPMKSSKPNTKIPVAINIFFEVSSLQRFSKRALLTVTGSFAMERRWYIHEASFTLRGTRKMSDWKQTPLSNNLDVQTERCHTPVAQSRRVTE